jgi:hemerythrin-like metal-binding protein
MEIGAPVLDAQRRALVERADTLLEAIMKGQDRPVIEKALKDFGDYAVRHFSTEEDCHLRGVCPAIRWSGVARAELIKVVAQFRISYERYGAVPAVADDLNCKLSEWVASYIPGPEKVLPCVTPAQ